MDDGLADLLHRVAGLVDKATRRRMDDCGLSHRQLRLLTTLQDIEPATQHRLAQALAVSDPAISRALRPLEKAGLVRVDIDPAHKRRRLVSTTETGRETVHATRNPYAAELDADFPYESYLHDTAALAEFLEPARRQTD
ncbi:MarR family winged helix-turn-helix transcriptional regulator [Nocardia brasiliensis]|uniref:MarR family winged helix-turn-helix transcriptional regulator n=1 Tax=Nocardia brasiliensis TaxID=37326 RepID=UPI0004A6F5F4|nr:MarR family transcriptional regulator [Nocardia brasiliensis]